MKRKPRTLVWVSLAFLVFLPPPPVNAQFPGPSVIRVNYTGRNAIQFDLGVGGLNFFDGTLAVIAGGETVSSLNVSHRKLNALPLFNKPNRDPAAAPFLEKFLFRDLPEGEITVRFTFTQSDCLTEAGDLKDPSPGTPIEQSATLGVVSGSLLKGNRANSGDPNELFWSSGEYILSEDRFTIGPGFRLAIGPESFDEKNVVVKSLSPDSSLTRSEILVSAGQSNGESIDGGELFAIRATFVNIGEIIDVTPVGETDAAPNVHFGGCRFVSDRFPMEIRLGEAKTFFNLNQEGEYALDLLAEGEPMPETAEGVVAIRFNDDPVSPSFHIKVFNFTGEVIGESSPTATDSFFSRQLRQFLSRGEEIPEDGNGIIERAAQLSGLEAEDVISAGVDIRLPTKHRPEAGEALANRNVMPRSSLTLPFEEGGQATILDNVFGSIEAVPATSSVETPIPILSLDILANRISGRNAFNRPNTIRVNGLTAEEINIQDNVLAETSRPDRTYSISIADSGPSARITVSGNSNVSTLTLGSAPNGPIANATVESNQTQGIFVYGSNNTIRANTAEKIIRETDGAFRSGVGLMLGSTAPGASENDTANNSVENNRVSGFERGIELRFATNNRIRGNTMENNRSNLSLVGEGDAKPVGNQVFNNILRDFVSVEGANLAVSGSCAQGDGCDIVFDAGGVSSGENIVGGSNLGGNFWDDYVGADADGDGIGDTVHIPNLLPRYQDRFPLIANDNFLVVNVTSDESDADASDAVADIDLAEPGVQTSLRAAIEFANANAGTFRIRFDLEDGAIIETGSNLVFQSPVEVLGDEFVTFLSAGNSQWIIETGASGSLIRNINKAFDSTIDLTINAATAFEVVDSGFANIDINVGAQVSLTNAQVRDVTINDQSRATIKGSNLANIRITNASNSIIGDTEQGNTIVGTIEIVGPNAIGNQIVGNRISPFETADSPDFSQPAGIRVLNASETLIQSNELIDQVTGVELTGSQTRNTEILGNTFRNVAAVIIKEGASANSVGGETADAANRFEESPRRLDSNGVNRQIGVGVVTGQQNEVSGNIVDLNAVAMIVDLAFDPSDAARPNENGPINTNPNAPNRLLNKPEILFYRPASVGGGSSQAIGFLRSAPNSQIDLELYPKSGVRPQRIQVETNANGVAAFSATLESIDGGIVATATDGEGNTSESSNPTHIYIVNSTSNSSDSNLGDGQNFTGAVLPNGAPEATLIAALQDIAARDFSDASRVQILFQIAGSATEPPRIEPETGLVFASEGELRIGGVLDLESDIQNALVAAGIALDEIQFNPLVEIHGAAIETEFGVSAEARSLTIDGLRISDCPSDGMRIAVRDSVVVSNSQFIRNGADGLEILDSESARAVPVGNTSTTRFLIEDCLIGVTPSGEIGRNLNGVQLTKTTHGELRNNTIGGNENGVILTDTSTIRIKNNLIGLFSESQSAPNGSEVAGQRFGVGIFVRGDCANITIGGETPGDGNRISANVKHGILITEEPEIPSFSGINRIIGNTFGGDFRNGESGIRITQSTNWVIGGPGPSANSFQSETVGIDLNGDFCSILGNSFVSNVVGLRINSGRLNTVGLRQPTGAEPNFPEAFSNTFNANDIAIEAQKDPEGPVPSGNIISQNSIFANLQGIVLKDGSHANIQPPVIRTARHDGATLNIDLAIPVDQLNLGAQYRVEVFRTRQTKRSSLVDDTDRNCDQGRTFIGAKTFEFSTDGTKFESATFDITTAEIGDEDNLSATLTVVGRGTSEFSNCFTVIPNDGDGDGASDAIEEEAVGDGDFNDNGIPDTEDSTVSAIQSFRPDGRLGDVFPVAVTPQRAASSVTIRKAEGLAVEDAIVAPPTGVEFPLGLVALELEVAELGDSASVTLPIPEEFRDVVNCFYKLVRNEENGELEWVCYERSEFDANKTQVTIELTDGLIGDLDLIVNRFISDPGGLAFDPQLENNGAGPIDSDGDGVSDEDEVIAGTDPNDRNDTLRVTIERSANELVLAFPTKLGRVYIIEAARNLGEFEPASSEIQGTGNPARFSVDVSTNHVFMRVRVREE